MFIISFLFDVEIEALTTSGFAMLFEVMTAVENCVEALVDFGITADELHCNDIVVDFLKPKDSSRWLFEVLTQNVVAEDE